MRDRMIRMRVYSTAAGLGMVLAGLVGLVGWTSPALATVCPTVDPSTGAVSPAPTPGVQWPGCNLTGANLTGANLAGANLADINFSSATLSNATLTNADLTDANFTQAIMSGADLTGATLAGVTTGLKSAMPPPTLPTNWIFVNSGTDRIYFAGPAANLDNAYLAYANLTDADLVNANLTGASIAHATITGADFTGATLAGVSSGYLTGQPSKLPASTWQVLSGYLIGPAANLSYAGLSGLSLSGADLAATNLTSAALAGTDLSYADLMNANLTSADVSSATLTGTNLGDATLTSANLAGATLTGANLTGVGSGGISGTPAALPANWSVTGGFLIGPGADLHGENLAGLGLTGADLSGANLVGTNFIRAIMIRAKFAGATLSGANLIYANLTDASFAGANLTGAYLSSAILIATNLGTATLTGASGNLLAGIPASLPPKWSIRRGYLLGPRSGTDLADVSLARANLSGVDLSGMTLLRTNLRHANLTRTDLTKTILNGTDFSYANLTRANMTGAKVSSGIFAATIWSNTICPDGTLSNRHVNGSCFGPPPRSAFTASQLPAGPSTDGFTPSTLACPSTAECFGGGTYNDLKNRTQGAVLLRLNGQTWSVGTAPRPPDVLSGSEAAASLDAMACPSTKACFAGGSYRAKTGNKAMVLTGTGGRFIATTAPLPANASANPFGRVLGIACPSVASCLAVGSYENATVQAGMILRRSGGKWTAGPAPVPPGSAVNGSVDAISCPSLTLCLAGGWQDNAEGVSQAVLLKWSAGTWSVATSPLPSGAAASGQAAISGLSCSSVTRCVAVGSYLDARGNDQAMLLTWSRGAWTAAKAHLPQGAAGNPQASLTGVSCPGISSCTAVGGYTNTASEQVALILTWSGKTWRAIPAPTVTAQLNAVSCPSLTECFALGTGHGHAEALAGP